MGKNICDTCIGDCKQPEFSVTIMCRNYKTQYMLDNPPEKKVRVPSHASKLAQKRKTKVGTIERINDPLISIEDEIINQLEQIVKGELDNKVISVKPKRKYTKRKKK